MFINNDKLYDKLENQVNHFRIQLFIENYKLYTYGKLFILFFQDFPFENMPFRSSFGTKGNI